MFVASFSVWWLIRTFHFCKSLYASLNSLFLKRVGKSKAIFEILQIWYKNLEVNYYVFRILRCCYCKVLLLLSQTAIEKWGCGEKVFTGYFCWHWVSSEQRWPPIIVVIQPATMLGLPNNPIGYCTVAKYVLSFLAGFSTGTKTIWPAISFLSCSGHCLQSYFLTRCMA